MTRGKKGLSIGEAMKQRMGSQEAEATPEVEVVTPAPAALPPQLEPDPLEPFNAKLPRSLQRRLKIHAAVEGTKIQDVVRRALEEYLERQEKESKKESFLER